MLIYKIFRAAEWAQLQADGQTAGAPIDVQDGFVHFSTAAQAAETAARHFKDEDNLFLLAVNALALGDKLIWEPSRGGQLFPHLYRALRREDIEWIAELPLVGAQHRFPVGVLGYIDPARAQFDAFKALDRSTPIEMLNLVRFRPAAVYPQDHPLAQSGLSGAEAYGRYGAQSAETLARVGGEILWRGQFAGTLIGPGDETWDALFIARYPSAHAFLDMINDPLYKSAVQHRQAAVETSRLIRCAPATAKGQFA